MLRGGGHWTRDIAFSRDGKKMFISVGSHSNVFENPNENEERRADILEYNPAERDSGSMHPGYATPSVSRFTRKPESSGPRSINVTG